MIKTLTPRPVRRASREQIQRVGCRQTTAWWWIVETDQNKRTVTIEKIVPKVTVTPQHADDEMCIPVWNLPEERVAACLESGEFVDTGRTVPAGFVDAPVWRVVCPKLLASFAKLRLEA